MAVELATGYVSLTASAKGIQDSIAKEFKGVDQTAARAGQEAGEQFGGEFSQQVTQSQDQVAQSSREMGKKIAAGVAIGGVALAAFAKSSATKFLDLTSAVKNFQRVAGGTAEDTSALVFALRRVGIEPDLAAKAFGKLSKELASGKIDLANYGVTVKRNADGSVNMKEAVLDLADSLKKLDANKRAAAVFEIFGKSGTQLLPLLSKTRKELTDIFALAAKDHQIFTETDLDKAADYKKSIAELNLAIDGFKVQVGKAVIPLLKGVTDALRPLAQVFADNAEGIGQFAKIAGGPVVIALGALYLVSKALTFAPAIRAVTTFGRSLLGLQVAAAATETALTATGVASGTILPAAATGGRFAAIGTSLTAAGLGAAQFAAGVATLNPAALSAVLGSIIPDDSAVDKAWKAVSKSERESVAEGLKSATKRGEGLKFLQGELSKTQASYRKVRAELKKIPADSPLETLFGGSGNGEKLRETARQLEARMRALGSSLKQFKTDVKAAGGEVQGAAVQFKELEGIQVPTALIEGFNTKGLQQFREDLIVTQAVFGTFATQILVSSGVSAEGLKTLTKEAQATDQAIAGSFRAATSVIGAFGEDTDISGGEFIFTMQSMQNAAKEFASGLAIAAELGVDQGLLKSIAEAGPKALPELKGLLDAVRTNGVGAINQTQADTDAALAAITQTINNRIAGDAARGAAYGQAVGNAIVQGLSDPLARGVSAAISKIGELFRFLNGSKQRLGAFGFPEGAAATGGVHKGWTVVGEEGPELVNLGSSSRVLSHKDSMAKLAPASFGGGGVVYNVHVHTLNADANTGKVIIESVKAHERLNGPSPIGGGTRR